MKLIRGLLACAVGIFTGLVVALPAQADVLWTGDEDTPARTSLVAFGKVKPTATVTIPSFTCVNEEAVQDVGKIVLGSEGDGIWSDEARGDELEDLNVPFAAGETVTLYFQAKYGTVTPNELGPLAVGTGYTVEGVKNPGIGSLPYDKDEVPYWTFTFKNDVTAPVCKAPEPATGNESPEPDPLNCTQIGKPINKEDPLYRPELDNDGDGVACEDQDGQLAVTGADTTGITAAGGALVLSGGALLGWLYLQRRRRDAQLQE